MSMTQILFYCRDENKLLGFLVVSRNRYFWNSLAKKFLAFRKRTLLKFTRLTKTKNISNYRLCTISMQRRVIFEEIIGPARGLNKIWCWYNFFCFILHLIPIPECIVYHCNLNLMMMVLSSFESHTPREVKKINVNALRLCELLSTENACPFYKKRWRAGKERCMNGTIFSTNL